MEKPTASSLAYDGSAHSASGGAQMAASTRLRDVLHDAGLFVQPDVKPQSIRRLGSPPCLRRHGLDRESPAVLAKANRNWPRDSYDVVTFGSALVSEERPSSRGQDAA